MDYTSLDSLEIGPFGPTVSRVCFSISIQQDSVCEQDSVEVFSVVVSSRNGEVEVVPSQKVASVFLEDSAVCCEYACVCNSAIEGLWMALWILSYEPCVLVKRWQSTHHNFMRTILHSHSCAYFVHLLYSIILCLLGDVVGECL